MTSFSPRIGSSVRVLGGTLLSGGVGVGLYDFASKRNLAKVLEHIDPRWDDDWDRYTRVPPERYSELGSWFLPTDWTLVTEREKYDVEKDIGERTLVMVRRRGAL